jgi:hypothetical protein
VSCWLRGKPSTAEASDGHGPHRRGLIAVAALVTVLGITRAADAAVPYQRDMN